MPVDGKRVFNITNPEEIDKYLQSFAKRHDGPHEEILARYLNIALAAALKKRSENFKVLEILPKNAPNWLKKKWEANTGEEFHVFVPDRKLKDLVGHICDWIKGAIEREELWLSRKDALGRPLKLLKIGTLEQATKEAEKDMERQREILAQDIDQDMFFEDELKVGDIKNVLDCSDGYRWVQLLRPRALDRESVLMGHCIGNGSYDEDLPHIGIQPDYAFYSLRDSRNKPHATIEVDLNTKSIRQCKGKQNRAPKKEYLDFLVHFIAHMNLEIEDQYYGDCGLVLHEGNLYSFDDLPEGIKLSGRVDLTCFPEFKFVRNMHIKGTLVINMFLKPFLPHCLVIEGRLVEHYYDEEGYISHKVVSQGNTGKVIEKFWFRKHEYHRADGPAKVIYNRNTGMPVKEFWYHNGALHKPDGPAVITRDPISGKVISERYWEYGRYLEGGRPD